MKAPTLTNILVLVIEDMPENRRLFGALLRLEGATVIEADRALSGIQLAIEAKPQLILMDLQMPGMDGIEATQILRTRPDTRQLPIVIITASMLDEDRQRAFDAGCDEYIIKPIDTDNFGTQLQNAMRTRGYSAPTPR